MASLPKTALPRTSDGFQKKLDHMNQAGIETEEDAYKYASLMLGSIELELSQLKAYAGTPLVDGLIERYELMKERWEHRLEYTKSQLLKDE